MRTEQEFLVDVLQRLNDAGIEYMLTGSMASNIWGTPRTTHDLVFAVQGDNLDPEYLKHWAEELEVAADLKDLISGKLRPKNT